MLFFKNPLNENSIQIKDKKNIILNKKDKNSFLNNNKYHKHNKLKDKDNKFVYIKFYKYLNSIKNLTNYLCKKYNRLKKKINIHKTKKKKLHKKIIYYFINALEGGVLKFLFWKIRTESFNFRFNEFFNDIAIYEFWNMMPSEFKNIHSRINREHPYKHIYNLVYRSLLVYPYSIKVKPYTIIIRNFFVKKFLHIFEWRHKDKKDFIVLKIIKKSKKLLKFNKFYKVFEFNRIEFVNKHLLNLYRFRSVAHIDSINIINLFRKKIKFLHWVGENWLWRYRNNFKIIYEKREFSLNYQYFLLKIFKFNISKKYRLYTLPYKIFLRKFFKIIIKKFYKKFYLYKKNIKKKKLKYKSIFYKFIKYRWKDYIIKNNKKSPVSFFLKIYNLYFYWLIFLMQKIYSYLNNIMFTMYLNFFYISGYLNLKVNFFLFSNNYHFLRFNPILNIEDSTLRFYSRQIQNKLYYIDYYCLKNNNNNVILDFINYYNKIKFVNLNCVYLKNLQLVYIGKIYKLINDDFIYLLDYVKDNIYSVCLNFKKFILQTNRFINHSLNKRVALSPLKINSTNINIANYINITHLDFLNIKLENIDLDSIKLRKMHYNHKILGFNSNINDISFKNYELFKGDDKRFYYI